MAVVVHDRWIGPGHRTCWVCWHELQRLTAAALVATSDFERRRLWGLADAETVRQQGLDVFVSTFIAAGNLQPSLPDSKRGGRRQAAADDRRRCTVPLDAYVQLCLDCFRSFPKEWPRPDLNATWQQVLRAYPLFVECKQCDGGRKQRTGACACSGGVIVKHALNDSNPVRPALEGDEADVLHIGRSKGGAAVQAEPQAVVQEQRKAEPDRQLSIGRAPAMVLPPPTTELPPAKPVPLPPATPAKPARRRATAAPAPAAGKPSGPTGPVVRRRGATT